MVVDNRVQARARVHILPPLPRWVPDSVPELSAFEDSAKKMTN